LLLVPLAGNASHIVGGEFELIHISGSRYRLNLVLYFDQLNGNPGARDPNVTARIFRMADNVMMRDVFLRMVSDTEVNYTQPSCSNGELVTRRLLYSDSLLILSPEDFNHPGGYYVSWERCCRNYNISNVVSLDPAFNPGGYAGQTFYLEFPPVVKNGQPFIDSTPRLFPPLNDYACPYRPYYTDFGGTDDDGDSLVYSLVTPLSTRTNDALPTPGPRPYPNVNWRAPYSLTNILNGSPDLRISRDGFLTVTPTTQGLFVFAVKVEEFRFGEKIGETRRDFQMLVVDACPIAVPPQILGKKLTDPSFTYDETMSISFTRTTPDASRCIQVRVSDPDSESIQDNFQERVSIKAVALNFKKDLTPILPTITNATLVNGTTVDFTICFSPCPFFFGGTPEIGIVAMDDACSLPLTDTLRVFLDVEAPLNTLPRFTSPTPVTATLTEGDQGAWPWSAEDDDGDPLAVVVLTNGFSLAAAGMNIGTISSMPGAANGVLEWDAFCDIYDFTQRTSFKVTVRLEDMDLCEMPSTAEGVYNLNVILPGNADPIIDSNLTGSTSERTVNISRRLTQSLNFTVTGTDLVDNDLLVLSSRGGSVDSVEHIVSIAPTPVTNTTTVSTNASWYLDCSIADLTDKPSELFNFQFIVVDHANKCRLYKADTLDVNVTVLPPLNNAPGLSVVNNNAEYTSLAADVLTITRGAKIDLALKGLDPDLLPEKDSLKIQLADQSGNLLPPAGFTFEPVKGVSPLETVFSWTPDCSIFARGQGEREFTISF